MEENRFALNASDVEERISDKTRLIIINSPSNPTGGVTSKSEIMKIAQICEDRGIFLLSDEIYARLNYSDKEFASPSALDLCQRHTIVLNGFSKAFAMTGWRLGIAIGPEYVIEKMGLLVSTIVSCVPPLVQQAGIAALEGDQTMVLKMRDDYRSRMRLLADGLNEINGLSALVPEGQFIFS